ncbi:hypothetical protein CsSME_00020516 [Camellia sinensis var. sinensis]
MFSSACILYLSHLSLAFFVCQLFGLGFEFCECLLLYLNLDHEWHDLYGHMHIPGACKIYLTYLQSSLNGSASNLPDGTGRSFATSFSAQSGAASPVFHHTGTIQGLHNLHGSFNVPNMPGTLASRNSTVNNVPSSWVQQPTGSLSSGRFASNNLPVALSQISHGSSHGHSGVTNRGGMSVVGSPRFSNSANGVGGSIPGIMREIFVFDLRYFEL